jgi:hypothetical protein
MDVQQTRQQRGGRCHVPNLQESRVASYGSGQDLLTLPIFAVYTAQDTMRLQAFRIDGGPATYLGSALETYGANCSGDNTSFQPSWAPSSGAKKYQARSFEAPWDELRQDPGEKGHNLLTIGKQTDARS